MAEKTTQRGAKKTLPAFTTTCIHSLKQHDLTPKELGELHGDALALHRDPSCPATLWEYTHIETGTRICSGGTIKQAKEKLADIAASVPKESMIQAVEEARRRIATSQAVAIEYTGTAYCDRCVPEKFKETTTGFKKSEGADW